MFTYLVRDRSFPISYHNLNLLFNSVDLQSSTYEALNPSRKLPEKNEKGKIIITLALRCVVF